MKILVINTGSSSIKYELFDMEHHHILASGTVEKIGEETSLLTHKIIRADGNLMEKEETGTFTDHHKGLNRIVELLIDREHGVIQDKSEITAVGHRVVHGGETFQSPTIIDKKVIDYIVSIVFATRDPEKYNLHNWNCLAPLWMQRRPGAVES